MICYGRDVELCTRMCVLVVDEGLCTLCRPQCTKLHCVSRVVSQNCFPVMHVCLNIFHFFSPLEKKGQRPARDEELGDVLLSTKLKYYRNH